MEVPHRKARLSLIVAGGMLLGGCAADPTSELENVARDWALTIRASQIIPVYPLSEDIRPGDVFLVSMPIGEQAEAYEEKGFLPTDNLVTRLQGLDFAKFYGDDFLASDYGRQPVAITPTGTPLDAPQAGFPTYTFSVEEGGGLQLALPIQGIPVGLGLMQASRAVGSVTISDAYTYGIDSASLLSILHDWFGSSPEIRSTLAAMVGEINAPIYLRVINRVYVTRGVDVSLTNLDALSGGADAGAAQPVSLPDLSGADPGEVKTAGEAYKESLNALSSPLNGSAGALPGGSVRFTQVNRRSVSMSQTFDHPLVVGYVGFDVKVDRNGNLSPPIPSFAVVQGDKKDEDFGTRPAVVFCPADPVADRYGAWLLATGTPDGMNKNWRAMRDWLDEGGWTDVDPLDLKTDCKLRPLLAEAGKRFGF